VLLLRWLPAFEMKRENVTTKRNRSKIGRRSFKQVEFCIATELTSLAAADCHGRRAQSVFFDTSFITSGVIVASQSVHRHC
jgi:hypothetical protein